MFFLEKIILTIQILTLLKMQENGGSVFGFAPVPDEKFGVIELDNNKNIVGIEEKPSKPKSNLIDHWFMFLTPMLQNLQKTQTIKKRRIRNN